MSTIVKHEHYSDTPSILTHCTEVARDEMRIFTICLFILKYGKAAL